MKEEYSLFVAEVRKWIEAGGDRKQAVDDAVDVCIEQGILRDILIRERAAIVEAAARRREEDERTGTAYQGTGEASGIKQEISFRKGVCSA